MLWHSLTLIWCLTRYPSLLKLDVKDLDNASMLVIPARKALAELLWHTMESPDADSISRCLDHMNDHCALWSTCGSNGPVSWDAYLFRARPVPTKLIAEMQFPIKQCTGGREYRIASDARNVSAGEIRL